MRDLSLHILDLAQNSVRANAALVEIMVSVDESRLITITIRDDGSGMSDELKERVTSPFATTRTTRKVGLGIPLMMSIYEATGVFQNVFVFGFIVDIVIIALVILAKKSSRTLRWLSE